MRHMITIDCDTVNILVDSIGIPIFEMLHPFEHIVKFDLVHSAHIPNDNVIPLSSIGYWTIDWKYHPPLDSPRYFNDWDHHFED